MKAPIAILAAAMLAGAATATAKPLPRPVNGYSVALTALVPGDTLRVIARWGESRDHLGPADAYDVLWTTNKGLRSERRKTGLSDTAMIPLPIPPDSVQVTISVTAVRRGTASATTTASRWFKRSDAAPPRPGPITIDTLTFVASVDSVIARFSTHNITVGDTLTGCALVRAGGRWYVGATALDIKTMWSGVNQARMDAYAKSGWLACGYIIGNREVSPDSLMPVEWVADSVITVSPEGTPEYSGSFRPRLPLFKSA